MIIKIIFSLTLVMDQQSSKICKICRDYGDYIYIYIYIIYQINEFFLNKQEL